MSDNQKKLNEQLINVICDSKTKSDVKLKKVKYLVRLGADVNARFDNKSVLVWAKKTGEADLIDFLEQKGAKVWEMPRKEFLALNKKLLDAVENNCINDAKDALEKGADVNQKDDDGRIALLKASEKGYKGVVEMLLQNGADVNQKDDDGRTALLKASARGYATIGEMLLEKGADVNARDKWKGTALIEAAKNGHLYTVELLLEKGADVNAKDHCWRTALMEASVKGHKFVVRILLENGADVNARDNNWWTAKKYAKWKWHYDIVEILTKEEEERRKAKQEKIKTTVDNFVNKIFGGFTR